MLSALAAAAPLDAQVVHVQGLISQMNATAAGNYGLRVYLSGNASFCSGSDNHFAFLEPTSSNYLRHAALLISAFLTIRS